jgi:hypothetical protein
MFSMALVPVVYVGSLIQGQTGPRPNELEVYQLIPRRHVTSPPPAPSKGSAIYCCQLIQKYNVICFVSISAKFEMIYTNAKFSTIIRDETDYSVCVPKIFFNAQFMVIEVKD